jgi:Domain of Unknown Function (DUF1206).
VSGQHQTTEARDGDTRPARNKRRKAARAADAFVDNRALQILARTGFATNGLIQILLGYIAIRVALNQPGESDQSGALASVAELPGGEVILWIAVTGMGALGIWLVVQAALGVGSSSKRRWARSLVSAGKAGAYFFLAWSALRYAFGRPVNARASTEQSSEVILSLPGGPIILAALGLAAAGIGVYFITKGIRRTFRADLTLSGGAAAKPVTILGIFGYVAKGIAVAIVGVLFIVAAVRLDPSQATGLDGALKSLASLPYGRVLLLSVAGGLILSGIYGFVRARYARF